MEYFSELGYVGLFLASFLAATILPLSSEVVLVFLLLKSVNPVILISVATFGNVLGSFVNYFIGIIGNSFVITKISKTSENDFLKAQQRFKKYGVFSLFFAWVPIIGDPLTVVAGVLKINILLFFVLVTSGKLIRYIIIAYATLF
ncbi:MAG: DedA family protein [Desulfobulbaceae bacterium]|nr:DedA family protein [Desulfobulbaceae bacterium]